jgi:hypothetical protein
MTTYGVNALGYPLIPDLPDTRPNIERAADLLGKSARLNVTHEPERQMAALQGIGFALLAIAEQLADRSTHPQEAPRESRMRGRFRRTAREAS